MKYEKLKNFPPETNNVDEISDVNPEKFIDNRGISKKILAAMDDVSEATKEYDAFENPQMLDRMNKYLDLITNKDLPNIIRGTRKHVEKFRNKIRTNHILYKRAGEKNEFINTYFYCICLKDYLQSILNSYDINIDINNDNSIGEAAHITGDDQTITMFLNPEQNLTIEEVTNNLAHEMWHHKQLEMAYCPDEDVRIEDTAAYQEAIENYLSASEFGIEKNINQPIEIEAYLFGREFLKRFTSDNDYIMKNILREKIGNRDNLSDITIKKDDDDDLLRYLDDDDDLLRYLSEDDDWGV